MTEVSGRYNSLRGHQKDINDVFRYLKDRLAKVKDLATLVAKDMENLGAFLQPHTTIVCPDCASVCCVNRHSYHALDDIVYIYAIGEKIPPHSPVIDDSWPCHFLGNAGCKLGRSLRPYRCNWYFCSPLLEHITASNSSRHYRLFIKLLEDISKNRQYMMEEYASVVKNIVR